MSNLCKYRGIFLIRCAAQRCMSTVPDPTQQSAFKRGTGGRSSFNGYVATVFGASGHLGRYVMAKIAKIGTQCIVPYRDDEYNVMKLKVTGDLGQILFSPFHLKDEDSLYKVMRYSNVVINLIERGNETSNFSFDEVHVEGARRIARIARECGVKRLIHLSALNASPNPKPVILKNGSGYNRSKWYGEQAVLEEFPTATIIRPAWYYGAEDKFIQYYRSNWRAPIFYKYYLWNKGEGIYKAPIWVSDVAQGFCNAMLDPSSAGKIYQAAGPYHYELGDILDYMHRVMLKDNEDFNYRRADLRKAYLYWLVVKYSDLIALKDPVVTWEKFEQEHTTDIVHPNLPTLKDLGVNLTNLEDRFRYELKFYEAYFYREYEFGEIDYNFALPKRVTLDY